MNSEKLLSVSVLIGDKLSKEDLSLEKITPADMAIFFGSTIRQSLITIYFLIYEKTGYFPKQTS